MPGSPAITGSRAAGSDDAGDGMQSMATHALPQVAMLCGSLALACGTLLVLRRLAGAIEPSPGAALVTCAAGAILVTIGDLAVRAAGPAAPSLLTLPSLLTRLGLAMAVTAVSLPMRSGTIPQTILTVLALIISLAFALLGPATKWFAAFVLRRPAPVAGRPREQTTSIMLSPATMPPALPPSPTDHLQTESLIQPAARPAGSLLQRFERLALPGGAEQVRGRLSVVVPAGTRTGYAHVGFCPPLAALPAVEVTTDYDGVEALVSAPEVLPWGVRVECRLDEPAEETTEIPVDILATTST